MKKVLLVIAVGIVLGTAIAYQVQPENHGLHAQARSPGWRQARAEHLLRHPVCEVCGEQRQLEVHHCIPFSQRPDLECEPSNLVTLCASPSCKSHLVLGHLGRYDLSNPHIREDAPWLKKRREEARRKE